jgi:hypothetical protein
VQNSITPNLRRIEKALNNLPKEAYDVFKSATPVKTGNARSKTKLKGDTITANYAYATELNDGKSKQAPNGMVEPTTKFLDKRIKQIMRKK